MFMFCVKKLSLLIDMPERLSTCLCPLFEIDISKKIKKVWGIKDIILNLITDSMSHILISCKIDICFLQPLNSL